MTSRRFAVRVAVLAVGVAALGAAAVAALRPPYRHWVEIEPRALYRSGWLDPDELKSAVRRYGIRTVVTLREERDELHRSEAETLEGLRVALLQVPLKPNQPPSEAQADQLRALLDDPRRLPILVHCRHGAVRAAGIEAFYRREYLGESAGDALENASRFGRDLAKEAPDIRRFIESLPVDARRPGSGAERAEPVSPPPADR